MQRKPTTPPPTLLAIKLWEVIEFSGRDASHKNRSKGINNININLLTVVLVLALVLELILDYIESDAPVLITTERRNEEKGRNQTSYPIK